MLIDFEELEANYLKVKQKARDTYKRLEKQKFGRDRLFKEKSFESPEEDTIESEEIWN